MSNITTTNRQAILDLIAQADETTEVTSIENRLTDLEDFIQVDATSGYATFSASQSIVSSVTDGTNTASVELDPTFNNNGNRLYATDGTNESSVAFNAAGLDIFHADNTDGVYVSMAFPSFSVTVDNTSTSEQTILTLDNTTAEINTTDGTDTSKIVILPGSATLFSEDGVDDGFLKVTKNGIQFKGIPSFADNAAAATGGLANGDIYRTSGSGAAPLNVAGILMIKIP
jgi:hypothetical protein